ncbi:MAG TPA: hypothetical protein DIT07_02115 [Sphingobacteriaceae bacterium]|nr:hypothetical protein [Sphingobacteriaceae bacterium]
MNLKTKKLNTTPVYSISLKQIEDYFKGDALEESSKKFLKAIGNQNLNKVFRPSAISVYPLSHDIYSFLLLIIWWLSLILKGL